MCDINGIEISSIIPEISQQSNEDAIHLWEEIWNSHSKQKF